MQLSSARIGTGSASATLVLCVCLLALAACASPLYKVAPVPKAPSDDAPTAASGGLTVTAEAMSDERAIAQMDANLLLAGLIAVQVHITNSGSSAIAAGALHASLRSPSDKTLAPIVPKKALQRVMKYYGTRLYGLEAYARTIESYESVALHLEHGLPPSESISGVLFFDTKSPVMSTSGYRLAIQGGPGPILVELK